MNCTKCGEDKPRYEGRVECMDCTRARSKVNHLKNHAKRLAYLREYGKVKRNRVKV